MTLATAFNFSAAAGVHCKYTKWQLALVNCNDILAVHMSNDCLADDLFTTVVSIPSKFQLNRKYTVSFDSDC